MKHKKIKIAALVIVTASLLGGILYSEFGTKNLMIIRITM